MTNTIKKLSVEQMRRLTLVRHLYNTAVIQSREADVRSGLAILPFHDAAEMFLQLACEQHEASKKKQAEFADYWSWLSEKGIKLTQSEGMKRLNKVRVSLKHYGILPAPLVMEGLRAEITNFFQDNTPIAFDIRFDQISLTSLITNQEISQLLVEAETALTATDHVTALEKAKTAFVLTLRKYEENARVPSHTSLGFHADERRKALINF